MSKYIKRSLLAVAILVILLIMIMSFGTKSSKANTAVLNLQTSTHAELIDFLYKFATDNRLNVQWFGWHSSDGSDKWFVRNDRDVSFKINLHMLSDDNGYLFFSNRFNEQNKANFNIDYGLKKPLWLEIVTDMESQLIAKGWLVRD